LLAKVQGNTIVNNVKAADLNGNGFKEIVTGGFTWNGENVTAQVKVWTWNGNILTERSNAEWADDYLTKVKCVSLNDVDGDGKIDIVTSGTVATAGNFANPTSIPDRGQLRVWVGMRDLWC
jgi:hypothetical protein